MARRDRKFQVIFLRSIGTGQQWLAAQDAIEARHTLIPRIPKRRRRKPAPPTIAELKGILT